MEKLSVSLEDYIEEIYIEISQAGHAKVTDIANKMGVKKASVSGALSNLAEKNLVNYAPYAPITLTAEGEKIAKNILLKHENLSSFFVEVLGADKAEAADLACKMEHIVSDKIFQNMIKLTEYTRHNLKSEIEKLF